ncbi:MAG: hypothetical protein JO061_16760 [Acidobacteriaceae bacterium]|nr:hypothetical protein [Acidobacteriaceae bacterium]
MRILRRSIGIAFPNAALFNSMSVEDNLALPLRELTSLPESTIKLMTWIKLWAVVLSDFATSRIVVLDEPSAGLDPIVAAGVDELILALKRAFSVTIVVVPHAMESANRIADRMAMLYQGSLIAVGTKDELRKRDHPRIRLRQMQIPLTYRARATRPSRQSNSERSRIIHHLLTAFVWRLAERSAASPFGLAAEVGQRLGRGTCVEPMRAKSRDTRKSR